MVCESAPGSLTGEVGSEAGVLVAGFALPSAQEYEMPMLGTALVGGLSTVVQSVPVILRCKG